MLLRISDFRPTGDFLFLSDLKDQSFRRDTGVLVPEGARQFEVACRILAAGPEASLERDEVVWVHVNDGKKTIMGTDQFRIVSESDVLGVFVQDPATAGEE